MGIHFLFDDEAHKNANATSGLSALPSGSPPASILGPLIELAMRGGFADDLATVAPLSRLAEIPDRDIAWIHADPTRARKVLDASNRSDGNRPALFFTPRHPFWDRLPDVLPDLVDPRNPPVPLRSDPVFGGRAHVEQIDWLALFWSLVQRGEEYDPAAPHDTHGRFPAWGSELSRRGWLGRPIADEIAALVASQLSKLDTLRQNSTLHSTATPRPWTLAVTHDVDSIRFWTWRRLGASLLRPSPEELDRLQATRRSMTPEAEETPFVQTLLRFGRRGLRAPWFATLRSTLTPQRDPHWSFIWLRQWESGRRIRPTLFILPERRTAYEPYDLSKGERAGGSTRRFLIQMRKWADEGAEIALHPPYDTPDFPQRLGGQRQQLAALFPNRDIRACRFHWLRFRVPGTWHALAAAGFAADATLGHAQHEGFRAATSHPFVAVDLRTGEDMGVVETPLTAMDTTLRHHRRLTPGQAFANLYALMSECRRHGGVFNLLWHTNSFDRHEWKGWRRVFVRIVDEALDQGAIPATVSEIAEAHRIARDGHFLRLSRESPSLESPTQG